jgi:hypothetical protein
MTLADAMIQSQKTWVRKPADFYPTPYNVTIALLDFLEIEPGSLIWEPGAADGDMVFPMRACELEVFASDIRETRFLEYDHNAMIFNFLSISAVRHPGEKLQWIITNPPFALAEEFIRVALEICPNVAMLVRSQYWHAATRLKFFQDNKPSYVLPLTWRPAFEEAERGKSPLMDVTWMVWNGKNRKQDPAFVPLARPTLKRMQEINEYCAAEKIRYGIPPRNSRLEKFIRKAVF